MTTDFATITHKALKGAIYAAVETGGDLHRASDAQNLLNSGAIEMDGAFGVGSMTDEGSTQGDQPDGGDTPGGIFTKGRFTVTVLTSRQSPGESGPSEDIADERMQKVIGRLYKAFRCVEDEETQVSGVTDIIYVGGRTAYAYQGHTDWYAVDVTCDIWFNLGQRETT